jgi:uncharacterized protein
MSTLTVKCPYCGKPSSLTAENPHRPFCSERCQLIDLGKWAAEGYAIPGEKVEIETEVNENPSPAEDDDESLRPSDQLH